MDKPKTILADFMAFLKKVNAIALAIAVVLGLAVNELVGAIVATMIQPVLNKLGTNDYGGFTIWVFQIGNLIGAVIKFVAVMAVLYVFSKAFLKEEKKPA